MLLGTEVGLGPGDIVLAGDPDIRQIPNFSTNVYCGQTVVHLSNITAELLYWY